MNGNASFLDLYKQNHQLPVRINTPVFGQLPAAVLKGYGLSHRKPNYFLLFMINGTTKHGVDLQQYNVGRNELLFILPHQIHQLPLSKEGTDYYKLSFDAHCLSLLPRQFSFLINPLNNQKIGFGADATARLQSTFGILQGLLSHIDTDPALVLVYLNCLLAEMDAAYFSAGKLPSDSGLSAFIGFKQQVENSFTDHPAVATIAAALGLSVSRLYRIVKHYSGLSPKEFIISRLMLEARRRLYYGESASVKELAYGLGFNDPEYFSRLFKKTTGKTIAAFCNDLSGK